MRKWRRELHKWDPESTGDENDLNAANVTSIDLNDLLDLQQLNDCKESEITGSEVASSDNKPKKSWADLVDEELNQTSTGKSIYDDIDDDDF